MKLLLDTQCWLWWFAQPERLNEQVITHIADENNELWLSNDSFIFYDFS
jgi:PIN domain nuclease of toxin-antitoxin system